MHEYKFKMLSGVVTSVIINADTNKILLGKRKSSASQYPDIWSIPGGYINAGSESAEDAIKREVKEETGIDIKKSRFKLFSANSELNIDARGPIIGLRYYVEVFDNEINPIPGDDLSELKWVSINDRHHFMDLAFTHTDIVLDAISHYMRAKPGKFNKNLNGSNCGLGVFRLQPLHKGHRLVIDEMIGKHDEVIIGLGSCNQKVSDKNPWDVNSRKAMIRNIYGSRVKILELNDLNSDNDGEWADYVFDCIKNAGFDIPTTYYSGSKYDAHWYENHFSDIIIVDRVENEFLSGTEIRDMIRNKNDSWKDQIPEINHHLVSLPFNGE